VSDFSLENKPQAVDGWIQRLAMLLVETLRRAPANFVLRATFNALLYLLTTGCLDSQSLKGTTCSRHARL